jgi:hypothetical protein
MTEFDLSQLVREVHHSTNLTDHQQVAKEVRSRIPDEHVEGAFIEALTEFVRVRFATMRPSISDGGGGGKPGNKSQKRDAIREWWRRQLNQRYGTADGQKLLRDFTVDDCLFQASMDREQAARLLAKSEEWDALAALLKKSRKRTVGDLP